MTDITELAHREKFEAWWERTQHNGNPPRFGWSHWRDGEGYKVDDDDPEIEGMWSAWKAAGAEMVEALEKAQQRIAELDIKNCELDSLTQRWVVERAENADRIAELESRTVKLPLPRRKTADDYVDDTFEPCDLAAVYNACRLECEVKFKNALTAAGIKVEAE
ncbi:TPA: hypothetical protein ACWXDE_002593 [Klebsiella pneumoniae]